MNKKQNILKSSYTIGLIKKVFRVHIYKRVLRSLKYKLLIIFHIKDQLKHQDEFFLIYTMGKVASSSIYETIKSLLPFSGIYHVHFLTEKNMNWRREFTGNPATSALENYVKKKIKRHPEKRLKIISIVRDITARDISMIFQNLKYFNHDRKIDEYEISDIEMMHEEINQDLSLGWFENEFQAFTGFDVYSHPFDKEKGYSVYHYNNMDILIIQLEKLNICYQEALGKFTDIKLKKLININETENKKEAKFYKYVKENIRMSKLKLEVNYQSKFMRHFYTETEIKAFHSKWNKTI